MNELEDYLHVLSEADYSDPEAFRELLQRGMRLLRLTDENIAHEFGVSRPTVTRWRNGTNAPHPLMRRPVYDWLRKRVVKFAKTSVIDLVNT